VLRIVALVMLCGGCDVLFELQTVPDARPIDAAPTDAPIAGLVAYYPMNELGPTATCMTDARGGPAGACHGTVSLVTSNHDHGYQFDGTAYITVPEQSAMPAPFTVAMWIRVAQALTANYECAANRVYGSGAANTWQICLITGGVYFGGGDGSYLQPDATFADGGWHLLAITYNGASIQGVIDGRLQPVSPSNVFFDAQPIVIGVDLDAGSASAPYYQQIDELQIYDRVLSETELAMLYQM
jgi:concanavalin A-like lectin/glucanase superfamily protein